MSSGPGTAPFQGKDMQANRPIYRVSADRTSASRRVRYVEYSAGSPECQLCQLDTLCSPGEALADNGKTAPQAAVSERERSA